MYGARGAMLQISHQGARVVVFFRCVNMSSIVVVVRCSCAGARAFRLIADDLAAARDTFASIPGAPNRVTESSPARMATPTGGTITLLDAPP
mmetsp:Transcript_21938/g.56003  ORF Transcript_21938/g.56003 Transcript_21938/m.56003 type:complete len:92 (-) Transcript_21938:1132-1407(-)